MCCHDIEIVGLMLEKNEVIVFKISNKVTGLVVK